MNTYIKNKLDEFDDNKFFKILNIPTDKVYAEKDGLRFDLQEINIKEIIEQAITEAYNKGQTDYHNHIAKQLRCRECNGSGAYSTPSDYGPCSYCDGTGLRPDGSLNDLLQDTNLKE